MRTRIVKIGNSQGVRIPKALLEESGLQGDVDMTVRDGALLITPAGQVRQGWSDAFRQMAEQGDDELLDGDLATSDSFDAESWEWE
jgi:antitoxin MazE